MRICEITSAHNMRDDRIFERACVGLANRGHDVTLIAPHDRRDTIEGVEIIPIQTRTGLRRRVFSSAEAWRAAKRISADVYIFNDPDLIPWMLLLALSGRKVVFDIHENYEARIAALPLPARVVWLLRRLYRGFERVAFRAFAGLTTVSESISLLYADIGVPQEITRNTVYLDRLDGIDLAPGKWEQPTVYTSGTNSHPRHAMQTVDSLPYLVSKIPDVRMVFAGQYRPERLLEQMSARAAKLGVRNHLDLQGMLPWLENFTRTAKAHVGCVLYEDNLNNRVTLPNRIFEYMACGVAVLASDYPELRRLVREFDCGIVVDSDDPENIARGAAELLQDPEHCRQMGVNGRKAIEGKLGFAQELTRLESFLNSIGQR